MTVERDPLAHAPKTRSRNAAESAPRTQEYDPDAPLEVTGINWVTTIFLISTLVISLITVPVYIWQFGLGRFEVVLFAAMFTATGLSITVGYHRLFSHKTFVAAWPVRLMALLFGSATFEMSALAWSAEHRHHHKYTDLDGDPHDPHSIKRGFFWAHVGWLLVRVNPELRHDNVADLRRDPLVVWQDKYYVWIAIVMGFLLPMAVGTLVFGITSGFAVSAMLQGLLAGFLFGGCFRIVVVQHATFLINSLAHMMGRRPYDGEASSRDSAILALFTFGEGYHNFHHAFQGDYRNGVRAWQWDPSKWTIWTLSKLGLATNLRRIPAETIRLARVREKRRRLEAQLALGQKELSQSLEELMAELEKRLEEMHLRCRVLLNEYSKAASRRADRAREVAAELRQARREFRDCLRQWNLAHRMALQAI